MNHTNQSSPPPIKQSTNNPNSIRSNSKIILHPIPKTLLEEQLDVNSGKPLVLVKQNMSRLKIKPIIQYQQIVIENNAQQITQNQFYIKKQQTVNHIQAPINKNQQLQGICIKYKTLWITNLITLNFNNVVLTWKRDNALMQSSRFRLLVNNSLQDYTNIFLTSNYIGSIYNIQKIIQQKNQLLGIIILHKQIIATIVYQSIQLNLNKVKQFDVYFRNNPQIKIQNQLDENGQPITLDKLYNHNKSQITKIKTKQPKYHQNINQYTHKFNGLFKLPSVNNYIVELLQDKKQSNKDVMVVTKNRQNEYTVKVSHPLSLLVAAGIVGSGLDFKICSQ